MVVTDAFSAVIPLAERSQRKLFKVYAAPAYNRPNTIIEQGARHKMDKFGRRCCKLSQSDNDKEQFG